MGIDDVTAEAVAVQENRAWLAANNMNLLLEIDTETWRVLRRGIFDKYSAYAKRLYGAAVYYRGHVYFAPMKANEIAVYDTMHERVEYLELEEGKSFGNAVYRTEWKFYGAFVYNDRVYFVGYSYPAIVEINPQNYSIQYHDMWVAQLAGDIIESKNYFYFSRDYFIHDDCLFLACAGIGALMKIDLRDMRKFETINLIGHADGFSAMVKDEDVVWLTGRFHGTVYSYDLKTGIVKMEQRCGNEEKTWCFSTSFCCGQYIYFIPAMLDSVLRIDRETHTLDKIEFENKGKKHPVRWFNFNYYGMCKEGALLRDNRSRLLFTLPDTGQITEKRLRLDTGGTIQNPLTKQALKGSGYVCRECAAYTLKEFLDGITDN